MKVPKRKGLHEYMIIENIINHYKSKYDINISFDWFNFNKKYIYENTYKLSYNLLCKAKININ